MAAGEGRYRAGQFARALTARLSPIDRSLVDSTLAPALAALFWQMPPGDQAHSVRVLQTLRAQGGLHWIF